ncbi:MAG: TatD family hydrolase [Oscillospiraceae bacterium]|nr:TatD family hydrolase [Oscillospiraceae bacterium]
MLSHIFDTHSHYDDPKFDGLRDYLIPALFELNISGIMHAATDLKSSEFGVRMANKYDKYYTAVGVHPENLYDAKGDYLDRLRELANDSNVKAIGEIGLDYHYEGYDREAQIKAFREQVELANSLNLPVIVHSRDATGDCMEILRELKPKGVMHCFSGSVETAREIIDLGMYISFTGVLTFKNAKKSVEVLKSIPIDRYLLETDCPYMSPEPHRGKICDSAMIKYTARKAAEILDMSYEDLVVQTEKNAKRLFSINCP